VRQLPGARQAMRHRRAGRFSGDRTAGSVYIHGAALLPGPFRATSSTVRMITRSRSLRGFGPMRSRPPLSARREIGGTPRAERVQSGPA
jgi:hypothetical protein